MINFYDGQIADMLPDNIKGDPIVIAISYAISNMVKKMVDHTDKSGIYASIDIMDEEVLDLLAVELRTKYYGDWLNLEEKKTIIKKTLLWYCRAGTPSTVQELTDFVFQDAHLEEWFQYGSKVFLFRPIVNIISQDMPLEKYIRFLKALYEVKNTRSHLEAVIFIYHKETEVRSVAAAGIGNSIKIKARTVKRTVALPADKNVSALFLNQNIRVRADNSIKENEVYLLAGDGEKERVFAGNGRIVKAARKEGG